MSYGQYTSDDGAIICALQLEDDTLLVMGFTGPAIGTPLRPRGLLTRKEIFVNSIGRTLRLPVPAAGDELPLGAYYTIRGDPTYFATSTLDEINDGEAT